MNESAVQVNGNDQASRLRALMSQASEPPSIPRSAPSLDDEPAPIVTRRTSGEASSQTRLRDRPRVTFATMRAPAGPVGRPASPGALRSPPSVRSPLRDGWGDPRVLGRRRNGAASAASLGAAPPVIIAIASGKGGVGKTSLSVNLCVALSRLRVRTVLIDGDIGLANADVLCGVRVGRHLGHVLARECALTDILIKAPGGFHLAPGASSTTLTSVNGRAGALFTEVRALGARCDAVIVDCGAGAGDDVVRFLGAADHRIVVTTPEPTAIADAYAVIKRLLAVDRAPRSAEECGACSHNEVRPRTNASVAQAARSLYLVVNQGLDAADARRAHQRISGVAERFLHVSIPILGWIPQDPNLASSVRAQSPVSVRRRRAPSSRAFARLARGLVREGTIDRPARRGWMQRIVSRVGV